MPNASSLFWNRARLAGAAALVLGAAAGCARGHDAPAAEPPAPVSVGRENIVLARQGTVSTGPAISGSLTAENQATVRAQTSGAVLQTYAEQGQSVRRGQLLARLDDASLRDAVISARSGVHAAEESATLAQRNAERAQRLSAAGAIADKDLEAAQLQAKSAQAQLEDARARLAQAEKQLANTEIHSPLAGVVSERPVSAGDVVQPGTALFTVVDPGSMRLEAAVPSNQLGSVHVGDPVAFTVDGYPGRAFQGKVTRVSPAVDPVTKQVPIVVAIPNRGELVAGLYAEGRVKSDSRQGVVVPVSAVNDASGAAATVMRIHDGQVQQVDVQLGLKDPQNETVEIASGLQVGDTLLVGAAQGITPGTPVRVQVVADPSATARR